MSRCRLGLENFIKYWSRLGLETLSRPGIGLVSVSKKVVSSRLTHMLKTLSLEGKTVNPLKADTVFFLFLSATYNTLVLPYEGLSERLRVSLIYLSRCRFRSLSEKKEHSVDNSSGSW